MLPIQKGVTLCSLKLVLSLYITHSINLHECKVLQNGILVFKITSETWNSLHTNMKTFNYKKSG